MKIYNFFDERCFNNLINIFKQINKNKVRRFEKNNKLKSIKDIFYKKRILEKTTYLNYNFLKKNE